MAWAIERVIGSLEKAQLDKETLIIFTSDHGPHRELCNFGGSTGQLRGKCGPLTLVITSVITYPKLLDNNYVTLIVRRQIEQLGRRFSSSYNRILAGYD